MKATRFDHCLLYGPNVEATYALFRDVLGFDLAEQVIDPEGNRGQEVEQGFEYNSGTNSWFLAPAQIKERYNL